MSDRTIEILKNKKIWLAKPNTLNDPYECKIRAFTEEEYLKEKESTMINQLMGFFMTFNHALKNQEPIFGLRQKDVKSILRRLKRTNSLEERYDFANNIMEKKAGKAFSKPTDFIESVDYILDNIGIFSLSEDPLNKLMWSHYSSSHQGIALGFEVDDNSILYNQKYFNNVKYTDEPLNFELSNGRLVEINYFYNDSGQLESKGSLQIKDPELQKIFFTKTTEWAYEKEWRYIREKFGLYDYPGKLVRIIFGLNCSESNIESIISLCSECFDYKIDFFKAVRVDHSIDLNLLSINS